MFRKFQALFRRRDDRVPIVVHSVRWMGKEGFELYAYDPQRETKRHLRAEIARLRKNKKRFSHIQAELDRLNGV